MLRCGNPWPETGDVAVEGVTSRERCPSPAVESQHERKRIDAQGLAGGRRVELEFVLSCPTAGEQGSDDIGERSIWQQSRTAQAAMPTETRAPMPGAIVADCVADQAGQAHAEPARALTGEVGDGEVGDLHIQADQGRQVMDPLAVVEAGLLAELDACLLTREEAASLEAGHSIEGMEEWEERRLDHASMAPWVARWWPAVRALHLWACMVGRVPGADLLARLGSGLARRVSGLGEERVSCPAQG